MINIQSKSKSYGINFPTSINELNYDILGIITKDVKLPKHYAIIALAFETKVFDFCAAMNAKHQPSVSVTPILAKISDEDSIEINAVIGDKLIVDRSSLERGVHINIRTSISTNAARNYFNSDPELVKSIMTHSEKDSSVYEIKQANIILLEFKIIPVTDISAAIPMNSKNVDPFIVSVNSCS